VIEYPELIKIHRNYKNRDFEFISISADNIENKEKVLQFLQTNTSAVKNYIYSQNDIYKLIELIDPQWGGALPYTLLVEPGGKIVFSCQGEVDLLELKKTILDNHMIGRLKTRGLDLSR
jgi:hypothetical protein